jgi:hypothetical protein
VASAERLARYRLRLSSLLAVMAFRNHSIGSARGAKTTTEGYCSNIHANRSMRLESGVSLGAPDGPLPESAGLILLGCESGMRPRTDHEWQIKERNPETDRSSYWCNKNMELYRHTERFAWISEQYPLHLHLLLIRQPEHPEKCQPAQSAPPPSPSASSPSPSTSSRHPSRRPASPSTCCTRRVAGDSSSSTSARGTTTKSSSGRTPSRGTSSRRTSTSCSRPRSSRPSRRRPPA